MSEFYLHFYSKTVCNVFINGELIGTIDNEKQFYIDVIVLNPTVIVSCEPLCADNTVFIPTTFKLELKNNKLEISNKNIKIVPFPNNNYDVILSFNPALISSANIYNKQVGDYNIFAQLDMVSIINIYNKNKLLFSTSQPKINNFTVDKLNTLILISGTSFSDKFLLIFNCENNKVLLCDLFSKIEKTSSEIKCLKNLNNTIKTGTVYCLNLKDLSINNYSVFVDNYTETKEQTLIPFSFLEAVKNKNYSLATTFLDNKLNETTIEKFNQFFGDFNEIYYNSYTIKSDKSNYTIIGETTRNFDFYLANNKITEIEEIIL